MEKHLKIWLLLLATSFVQQSYGGELTDSDQQLQECMARALVTASDDTTVGQLREQCQRTFLIEEQFQLSETQANTALKRRIAHEISASDNPFALIAHRPTYFLTGVYNGGIDESVNVQEGELDDVEAQFQMSFKIPLYRGLFREVPLLKEVFGENGNLSFAYTNRSFWQVYNSELSAPFRETNHEPEMIVSFYNDWQWGKLRNVSNQFIFNHQSNGRNVPFSRSWNRLMMDFIFEYGDNFAFSVKPWYRLPEALKTDPLETTGDDNPDITDFLGHFEWQGVYDRGGHSISLMIRDPITAEGAYELGWSFPINDRLQGYMKYFNGYGESLIDYNVKHETIGIGFQLTDWL
ncbi:phospholipase A [Porticoccus sp. W117]|uniref:phospholipase A n=1 Tax=Porticoccus sp. W117 TaxID=3054777 RepID=UPI002594130A|nr:phospholipase A [Porticoccus sp. W117]MDM3871143.1 phospholipase A [Porticoccus sp. W117]